MQPLVPNNKLLLIHLDLYIPSSAAFAASYAPDIIMAGPAKGIIGAANLTTGLAICFAYLPNFLNASPSFAFSGLSILSAVVTPGFFLKALNQFSFYLMQ